MIALYDPFLSSHLAKYGNQDRGEPSYLSSTICEEIIEILGNQVLGVIVKELQQSKYFSVSIDSTPDISHIDQLTIVVRYVRMSDGEVVEQFLTFIPIESHTGEALATTVLKFLNIYFIYYISCASHSLNLVGVSAAETCVKALSFFGFVQNCLTFFLRQLHVGRLCPNVLKMTLALNSF